MNIIFLRGFSAAFFITLLLCSNCFSATLGPNSPNIIKVFSGTGGFELGLTGAKKKAIFSAKYSTLKEYNLVPNQKALKIYGISAKQWVAVVFPYFFAESRVLKISEKNRNLRVDIEVQVPPKVILEAKKQKLLFSNSIVIVKNSKVKLPPLKFLKGAISSKGFNVFEVDVPLYWKGWSKLPLSAGEVYDPFNVSSKYFSENVMIIDLLIGEKRRLNNKNLFPVVYKTVLALSKEKEIIKRRAAKAFVGKNKEDILMGNNFRSYFVSTGLSCIKPALNRKEAKNIILHIVPESAQVNVGNRQKNGVEVTDIFLKFLENIDYIKKQKIISKTDISAIMYNSPILLSVAILKNPNFTLSSWNTGEFFIKVKM